MVLLDHGVAVGADLDVIAVAVAAEVHVEGAVALGHLDSSPVQRFGSRRFGRPKNVNFYNMGNYCIITI